MTTSSCCLINSSSDWDCRRYMFCIHPILQMCTNHSCQTDHLRHMHKEAYLSNAKGSSAGTSKSLSSFPDASFGWIFLTASLWNFKFVKSNVLSFTSVLCSFYSQDALIQLWLISRTHADWRRCRIFRWEVKNLIINVCLHKRKQNAV